MDRFIMGSEQAFRVARIRVDIEYMSVVGSPLETSALQAIQAQHVASKARDKEKAESSTGRRFNDLVELRVTGLETADAVRQLPQNNSEQAESERQSQKQLQQDSSQPRIDLKA
jgi:hypothetical protein